MRDTIETLANQIKNQPHLKEEEKQELLSLIADIESEVDATEEDGDADSVKEVVRLTVEGAEQRSVPSQFEDSLLNLEASYPKTAAALGRIGNVLARMGI